MNKKNSDKGEDITRKSPDKQDIDPNKFESLFMTAEQHSVCI